MFPVPRPKGLTGYPVTASDQRDFFLRVRLALQSDRDALCQSVQRIAQAGNLE
jgi:hypothetical protein